ncbi:MAG: ATP-binding protein [Candidatus Saccharibacteria bacterium]
MNILSLLSILAAIVYLYLGYYAIQVDPKAKLNRVFLMLCCACFLWAFCGIFLFPAPSADAAMFWLRAGTPGWAMVPAIFMHFIIVLVGKETWINKPWRIILLYLPGFISIIKSWTGYLTMSGFVLAEFGWNGIPHQSPWYWFFSIYYVAYILISLGLVYMWGKHSSIAREKRQARVIEGYVLITLSGNFINETLLPYLGILSFPKVPHLLGLIWAFGLWYAIAKLRLMALTPAMATEGILTKITDMMLLVNSQGKIVQTNSRVGEILGFKERDLLDRPLGILLADNDISEETIRNGILHDYRREVYLLSKTSEHIPVDLSGSAVFDNQQDFLGYAIIAQDLRQTKQLQLEIVERKKAEEALQASYNRLKQMDQTKTDFMSMVSHELRTPLTSILGFVNIVKSRLTNVVFPLFTPPNEKAARAVQQINENLEIVIDEGHRLTNLINDLLDIAKLEAGKIEWKMNPVAMGDLITKSMEATGPLFKQHGVIGVIDIEFGLPMVVADHDRLEQVMINLISNALKFTETGSVTCRARSLGNEIRVSVVDTGPGIAPEDLAKIFEKFEQGSESSTSRPKGTGLGLAISKQIIEHHGGRIWAESELGQGATFSFTLPLK